MAPGVAPRVAPRGARSEEGISIDSGARLDAREGARRVGSEDEQGREHRGEQAFEQGCGGRSHR